VIFDGCHSTTILSLAYTIKGMIKLIGWSASVGRNSEQMILRTIESWKTWIQDKERVGNNS